MACDGSSEKLICLGVVSGAVGVKGEVRIKSFTQEVDGVAAYGRVRNEDGSQEFEIKRTRSTSKGLVAKLDGVDDRNAAEALKGTMLYVTRDQLSDDMEEDEFYHADLIGLEAKTMGGEVLGTVTGVFDFGAGDLLEIALTGSGDKELVPFTKEVVTEVNLAGAFVLIDLPPGLMPEPKKGKSS